MSSVSQKAPLGRTEFSPLPDRLRALWRRYRALVRARRYLAALNDRDLNDIALPRDFRTPPHPRDTIELWRMPSR